MVISRAFPSSEKTGLFVKDGVAVVDPARAVDLARIMRRMVCDVYRAGLTAEGQQAKSVELCEYLGSPEFRRAFDSVAGSSDELTGLLGKERKWHEQNWAKRQSIYTDIGSKTATIDARIRTIIEKSTPAKGAKVVRLQHPPEAGNPQGGRTTARRMVPRPASVDESTLRTELRSARGTSERTSREAPRR